MANVREDIKIPQTVKLPILTYHSIDESGAVISTAPEVFRRQMNFLGETGYNVVSLDKLLNSLIDEKPFSAKTVALTFDDGFQNFYTTAFPVLEQYGFKATVFLVTDYCGKYNDWAGNPPDLPRSKVLAWNEIKELNKYGIEFGSHTRTHPDLTQISFDRAEGEMVESKAVIEDSLGCPVTTFAYPFGKYNQPVKKTAEKTFQAACSTNLGKVECKSDFFSLARIDTYYLSNLKIFNSMSSKTFDRYMQFRQVLRDFKATIRRS
ncbi:MAG: polysaccharide deacetylase family protein [Actinomycetota bacterium]